MPRGDPVLACSRQAVPCFTPKGRPGEQQRRSGLYKADTVSSGSKGVFKALAPVLKFGTACSGVAMTDNTASGPVGSWETRTRGEVRVPGKARHPHLTTRFPSYVLVSGERAHSCADKGTIGDQNGEPLVPLKKGPFRWQGLPGWSGGGGQGGIRPPRPGGAGSPFKGTFFQGEPSVRILRRLNNR